MEISWFGPQISQIGKIPGYFADFLGFASDFAPDQLSDSGKLESCQNGTPSSFPGNFRKRKDQSAGDPLVSFFSVCSSYEHTPVGELLTGFAMRSDFWFPEKWIKVEPGTCVRAATCVCVHYT